MSDIEIGSVWIDKSNDKIVATVTRLMPENKALQYKTSTGWTTSSVEWFLEDFKPQDELGIKGFIEAAKKLREFQSKDTDEYKTIEDYNYDLWGAIGDVVYELNKYETKIKNE